jgi:glycosyltransferase involved in cell wall biosynthesis
LQAREVESIAVLNQVPAINAIVADFEQNGIRYHRAVVQGKCDLYGLNKFANLLRQERPDVVHFHLGNSFENFLPIVLTRLYGIKIVVTEHCPFYPLETRRIKYVLKKLSLHAVQRVILLGDNVQNHYLSQYPGASDKIAIVPPFSRIFPPRQIARIINLGMIGEFSKNKGIDFLLESAPFLIERGYRLMLWGKGTFEPQLQALSERSPRSVEVFPFVQDQGVCYETIDVLLLLSEHEGLPLVVLEAISAGIPVIATDVGVIREYFSHSEGVLFLKDRSCELILEHIKCLQQQEFRETVIRRGSEKFSNNLTPAILTNQILTIYQGF